MVDRDKAVKVDGMPYTFEDNQQCPFQRHFLFHLHLTNCVYMQLVIKDNEEKYDALVVVIKDKPIFKKTRTSNQKNKY